MLHLFDKVYIVSDVLVNINFDRVVISQQYGKQMSEALDKIAYGDLIAYGATVDEALTNSTFPEFIQLIKNKAAESNKKIIIYADDLSFSKFTSLWFKSIFKNISAESAWLILSSYIEKEKLMKGSREAYTSTTTEIFPLLTEEQFTNDFSSAQSHDLVGVESSISFEILLANYISNNTHKEELKSSVINILKRALTELAIEIKYSYVKNFKNPKYPVIADGQSFFTNSSIYTGLNLGRVSSQHNTTDLSNATDEDIAKFKTVANSIMLDWEQFQPQSTIFSLIQFVDVIRQPEITDADLELIIDFEKNTLGTIRIFSSADEEKINIYFLRHVLSSVPADLEEYELK
jgi:hypothetical protein